MHIDEKIFQLWPVFLGITGLIVWLVRVEQRTYNNELALKKLEKELAIINALQVDILRAQTKIEVQLEIINQGKLS